jgi:signal transduction histidine kinase
MMIHLELLRQQIAGARPTAGRGRSARGGLVEPRAAAVAGAVGPRILGAPANIAEPQAVSASPEALQHVDVIAGEIRRLDQVLQGFLKFTRPEDLKLQPVNLSALINEVIPVVHTEADQAGVSLVVECDNAPDVNGDPAMLRQAFLNLALNACQAMPNGGSLRIRCERHHGHRVSIRFTDTGTGIAPEHLKRIFDLYFTTKEKGSGIGLSMVFRTVQMHDGEIEVESTPGAGTTFRVLLPQA